MNFEDLVDLYDTIKDAFGRPNDLEKSIYSLCDADILAVIGHLLEERGIATLSPGQLDVLVHAGRKATYSLPWFDVILAGLEHSMSEDSFFEEE